MDSRPSRGAEIALQNALARVIEAIALSNSGGARKEAASLLSSVELDSALAPEVHRLVLEGCATR